jgi:hypothetical protein
MKEVFDYFENLLVILLKKKSNGILIFVRELAAV